MNFLKRALFGAPKQQVQKQLEVQQEHTTQQENVPVQILSQIFQKSAKLIAQSSKPISDQNKLIVYGLYKQATAGDCNTSKPSIIDFVGRSKWTSWDNNKGMAKSDSMKAYISKAVQLDSQIQNKMQAFLQGHDAPQHQTIQAKQKTFPGMQGGAALKMVQQNDYSATYTHPYFKLIQHDIPIKKQEITKQLLLQKNNNPKCYPLHFAIDKERVQLVKDFLDLLSAQEVLSMKDEDETTIQEYAQLIDNREIIQLVKIKLKHKQ